MQHVIYIFVSTNMTVGSGQRIKLMSLSFNYSDTKVFANVTLKCDQDTQKDFQGLLLLLLLSRFSRVRLCATPQMAAHQAPPSLGFSRQEHWSGLPFPPPMHESKITQSCPTLNDPMNCSPPGSTIHGIFQARVLKWGAIAFSERKASRTNKE